jgi:tRNA A22 N-methylase
MQGTTRTAEKASDEPVTLTPNLHAKSDSRLAILKEKYRKQARKLNFIKRKLSQAKTTSPSGWTCIIDKTAVLFV